MKNLLLTLIAFSFLFVANFEAFSQTTSKRKLVKCYEKGKVVYRTKCKSTKNQTATKKKPVIDEPYGTPNSAYSIPSDGTGSGGGLGTGRGQGVGRGQGSGDGMGSGTGDGPGPGTGRAGTGGNTELTIPKPPPTNTTPLKILSKPKAEYTDAARTNQVQGTVTLRVTFLANGTIGSVTPVSGLPDGLTQQAINAAKMIRFEPAKRDGKPISITKQFQYSFTLY